MIGTTGPGWDFDPSRRLNHGLAAHEDEWVCLWCGRPVSTTHACAVSTGAQLRMWPGQL